MASKIKHLVASEKQTQVRLSLQQLTTRLRGPATQIVSTKRNGKQRKAQRISYCSRVYWTAIEEALLIELMKEDKDPNRSAVVRRAIHSRAMDTLGEKSYYEIIGNPQEYLSIK